MKLTLKQKAFADFYIEVANATEAARRAGYKGNNINKIASANLAKPHIKEYIDERVKEIEDKRIAKAQEVLKYLTEVMRGEEVEEVVITENIGDYKSEGRIIKKEVAPKEKIKAAELLGKRYGLFANKIDIGMRADLGVKIVDDIDE